MIRPHFQNFNKRLVKAPKLYFGGVGLVAWLLGIRMKVQIAYHAQRGALHPVEVKSGQTIATDFFKGMERWNQVAGRVGKPAWLVYGGDQELRHGEVEVIPWSRLPELEGRM